MEVPTTDLQDDGCWYCYKLCSTSLISSILIVVCNESEGVGAFSMCLARFCFVLRQMSNSSLSAEKKVSELSDCSVPHFFNTRFLLLLSSYYEHHLRLPSFSHKNNLPWNSFLICYLADLFKLHKSKLHYHGISEWSLDKLSTKCRSCFKIVFIIFIWFLRRF